MKERIIYLIKNILKRKKKKDNSISNCVFLGARIIGDVNNIKIGTGVSFGGAVLLCASSEIEIGDYTMIAVNAIIHTSTHDYNSHPMWLYRIDRPVKIGKHVWIGAGSIILPGIIIEDYAVIGAGSIVTKNVPQGAIVVGNPARITKYRNPEVYNKKMNILNREESIIVNNGYCNINLS